MALKCHSVLMMKSLDLALYGQILNGKGPWPQGPIAIYKRKCRQQWHDATYGKSNKCSTHRCPVCKKPIKINV